MTKGPGSRGLEAVREVYKNRDRRARELKGEGKRIIGYFCCYPPGEIITAANLVPYRITGDVREPITKADSYLEPAICPYLRSCFDIGLKGRYEFLDGLVTPHSCQAVRRIYPVWREVLQPRYGYYLEVPHMARPASFKFFKAQLSEFKRSIEGFVGGEISDQDLHKAIKIYNQNRALIRELYNLRKQDPPLLSGVEMTQVIVAAMSIPIVECNELLGEVISEVKERQVRPGRKGARVLVYGCEIDNTAFMQLIEESGANVVVDDLCIGTRHYWHDVEATEDPLDGLAARYLDKIPCPRTFRAAKHRFQYLLDYARSFGVDGVILYIIRFCDSHGYDAIPVRDYLRENGVAVLHLTDDYSLGSIAQLRTRVQAFLELIEKRGMEM